MKHIKKFDSFSVNEEIGLLGVLAGLGFTAVLAKLAELALEYKDSADYKKNYGNFETGETVEVVVKGQEKPIIFKVIEKEGKRFYSAKVRDFDDSYSKSKTEVADKVFVYDQEQFDKLLENPTTQLSKTKSTLSYTPPQLFKRYIPK